MVKSRVAVAALVLLSALTLSASSTSEDVTDFTVTQPTQVPGTTLQPGTYSIKVMDHLQDRFILRIEGAGGSPHTLFIAVPAKDLKKSSNSGVVTWDSSANQSAAMRGFVFAGKTSGVEFVYPKDEAVSLAQASHNKVLAVDPASEGRSPELSKLTSDEAQMVTLWMLTPAAVTADSNGAPKISASKYESAHSTSPDGRQVAAMKPPIHTLPHTASELPLLMVAALLSLLGAGAFRKLRLANLEA